MLKITDFYADWCAPCQAIKPILEELENEYEGKVSFDKVNVDQNQAEVSKFSVMSIPTLVMSKEDKEIDRKVGLVSKDDLKGWIDKNL